MNIINVVVILIKDKMSLRGGLGFWGFFLLRESIEIIVDDFYFIF